MFRQFSLRSKERTHFLLVNRCGFVVQGGCSPKLRTNILITWEARGTLIFTRVHFVRDDMHMLPLATIKVTRQAVLFPPACLYKARCPARSYRYLCRH